MQTALWATLMVALATRVLTTRVEVVTHRFAVAGETWVYGPDMPSANNPVYSTSSNGVRETLQESLDMAQQIINGSCGQKC